MLQAAAEPHQLTGSAVSRELSHGCSVAANTSDGTVSGADSTAEASLELHAVLSRAAVPVKDKLWLKLQANAATVLHPSIRLIRGGRAAETFKCFAAVLHQELWCHGTERGASTLSQH